MTTAEQTVAIINEILADVEILKSKGIELGISISTDQLEELVAQFNAIQNRGAVTIYVEEGQTKDIPAGYYPDGATTSGTAGEGKYLLQDKTVTPLKTQQVVVSDEGYYGLAEVTIQPIPDIYKDVSMANVTAGDILTPKVAVTSAGAIAGTMPNNGIVAGTIDGLLTDTFSIPAGYYAEGSKVTMTDSILNRLKEI